MKVFSPKYHYSIHPNKGFRVKMEGDLDKFNVDLLNIGDLKAPSKPIEVLSALFDLDGFTNFTRQVDPQLSIPNFISDFFNWLFAIIRKEMTDIKKENLLWAELPFFSKFMGDGALFLWRIDLNKITRIDKNIKAEQIQEHLQMFITNIIASMYNICEQYKRYYQKLLKRMYVEPPNRLRRGIARGNVFPIGNNHDYVGPCINISSRLLKFDGLSFAFSARGIDEDVFHEDYKKDFIKKQVNIKGIGENELIYILKDEFDKLPEVQKAHFLDV